MAVSAPHRGDAGRDEGGDKGLRATSRGGRTVIYEAVRAQLDPPLGSILRPFNRMRARRNEVEYRSSEAPSVTPEEVAADLKKVEALIELAEKAIPNMPRC
ncbi:hypothetical protein [Streptomyces flaveus]|uniref:hypothetical protein n=1 Tax=Streptomyces flaveus TaxID=66370 RepID=UPI00331C39A1